MPLRCLFDNQPVSSFELTDAAWNDLKQGYRSHTLVMACCGAPGIPKVSNRGTRFFAHKSQGDCATAPESEAHLRAKWIIARAAIDAGWTAETEVRGSTPAGE